MNGKRLFTIVILFSLLVIGTAQSASAWWGYRYPAVWGGPYRATAWYGGWYGFGGYYGWDACCAPVVDCCAPVVDDCCGTVVASSGSVYAPAGWAVRRGPVRRLLFGRYRWYGGYWGGWGYGDCCPGYYVSTCCGDAVYDGVIQDASPASRDLPESSTPLLDKPSVMEKPEATSASTGAPIYRTAAYASATPVETPVPANSGILSIFVPIDAVVYVNDFRTATDGSARSFVSYGLQTGNEYDYVIRAEVIRDGQKHVETKLVTLQAGGKEVVTFAFEALNSAPGEEMAL